MSTKIDWSNWILTKNCEALEEALRKTNSIALNKMNDYPDDNELANTAAEKGYTVHFLKYEPKNATHRYSIKHRGKPVGTFFKDDISFGGKLEGRHDSMFDNILSLVRRHHEKASKQFKG